MKRLALLCVLCLAVSGCATQRFDQPVHAVAKPKAVKVAKASVTPAAATAAPAQKAEPKVTVKKKKKWYQFWKKST